MDWSSHQQRDLRDVQAYSTSVGAIRPQIHSDREKRKKSPFERRRRMEYQCGKDRKARENGRQEWKDLDW